MNIYFNFQKTAIVKEPIESLKDRILRDTILKNEFLYGNATFTGKLKNNKLYLKRYSMFWNTFRPIAVLNFTSGSNGKQLVKIKYILGFHCYLFLLLGVGACIYAVVRTNSYIFIIPAFLWGSLWYIFGFVLYFYDYRLTKREIEKYFR